MVIHMETVLLNTLSQDKRTPNTCTAGLSNNRLSQDSPYCKAFNIGVMNQQFPDLETPSNASKFRRRSLISICKDLEDSRLLEHFSGASREFKIQHKICENVWVLLPVIRGHMANAKKEVLEDDRVKDFLNGPWKVKGVLNVKV